MDEGGGGGGSITFFLIIFTGRFLFPTPAEVVGREEDERVVCFLNGGLTNEVLDLTTSLISVAIREPS